ncbi:hypothetical protein, partial [Streptococcus pneumoniae]
KIGLTTTLKNAWTTSRQVNFFWVANFNLKFGKEFPNAFQSRFRVTQGAFFDIIKRTVIS